MYKMYLHSTMQPALHSRQSDLVFPLTLVCHFYVNSRTFGAH